MGGFVKNRLREIKALTALQQPLNKPNQLKFNP